MTCNGWHAQLRMVDKSIVMTCNSITEVIFGNELTEFHLLDCVLYRHSSQNQKKKHLNCGPWTLWQSLLWESCIIILLRMSRPTQLAIQSGSSILQRRQWGSWLMRVNPWVLSWLFMDCRKCIICPLNLPDASGQVSRYFFKTFKCILTQRLAIDFLSWILVSANKYRLLWEVAPCGLVTLAWLYMFYLTPGSWFNLQLSLTLFLGRISRSGANCSGSNIGYIPQHYRAHGMDSGFWCHDFSRVVVMSISQCEL